MTVRPKHSLLSNAFVAVLLGTTPPFLVVYWFAASRGGFALVPIAHLAVLLIGLGLFWRQLQVYCAITSDELIGNGIFSPFVRVPLGEIHQVLLVPVFVGAAPEPVLQLLVRDAQGRRLFRMRGRFWHESDLRAFAAALPVPVETVPVGMTMRDFFRSYPGAAFWFEGVRPLPALLLVLGVLALIGGVAGVMLLLGLPVRFL